MGGLCLLPGADSGNMQTALLPIHTCCVCQALAGTPAEGRVSAADLIALAGARAVRITGGPDIDVPIGG